jgi:hypothetical protein
MPLELDQPTQDMSQSTDTPIGAQPGEVDREGAMAKQDLEKIATYSQKLDDRLQDTDQLEAWVQKKIAVAAENLASVYHYLAYEMTVNEYAEYLRKNGLLSEGTSHPAVRKLMEAKAKIKELKKAQVDKKAEKNVAEGILSGGERPCTECGGSGMVYEEPKAIPDHVKGKVEKYNTMVKATKAAHKRMDANHNGIPDDEEVSEEFGGSDKEMKVGDKKKTRTGELTKTSTGVVHKNTSYHDDGEAEEKSGKGIKSHAKSQSAAEKKEKAPAQKFSPKKDKTWGMKDNEKFDNRDKEVDETYGLGVYEAKGKCCCEEKSKTKCPVHGKMAESAKPSAGLSAAKKSAVVKKAKAGGDIGKPGKSFDKTAKAAGGGEKGEKIAAAAMWKNIKETTAYMAEKKAVEKKDKPMKGSKIADEGNAYGNAVRNTPDGEEIKINGKGTGDIKRESTDFTRMQEQLARLNRNETKTAINEGSEVNRLRALTNLFKG